MPTGGAIRALSLAGRNYAATEDTKPPIDRGGVKNERKMNGDGSSRLIRMQKPFRIEDIDLSVEPNSDDVAEIERLAAGEDFSITIEYADNTILSGTGNIEGDVKYDPGESTVKISISGEGVLS